MQRLGHKSEKWELSGLEQHCALLMVGVLIRWWEADRNLVKLEEVIN